VRRLAESTINREALEAGQFEDEELVGARRSHEPS
jgi:hypothetical protein